MKPNEARKKRRLPPVAGGDAVYLQQQNYSTEALAKRDAQEDPFGAAKPPAPPPVQPAEDSPEDDTKAALAALQSMVSGLVERSAEESTRQEVADLFRSGIEAEPVTLETLCG
jgi:hypothetical protein